MMNSVKYFEICYYFILKKHAKKLTVDEIAIEMYETSLLLALKIIKTLYFIKR